MKLHEWSYGARQLRVAIAKRALQLWKETGGSEAVIQLPAAFIPDIFFLLQINPIQFPSILFFRDAAWIQK